MSIRIEEIAGRKIAIKGVGKLFYEKGYPISMAVSELRKQGIEVSILHVADECLKNGWSPKTTISKLEADFQDDVYGNKLDVDQLKKFCFAEYLDQREMIFQYLFGSTYKEARSGENTTAIDWQRDFFKKHLVKH